VLPLPPELATGDQALDAGGIQDIGREPATPVAGWQLGEEFEASPAPIPAGQPALQPQLDQLLIRQPNPGIQPVAVTAVEQCQVAIDKDPIGLLPGTQADTGIQQG